MQAAGDNPLHGCRLASRRPAANGHCRNTLTFPEPGKRPRPSLRSPASHDHPPDIARVSCVTSQERRGFVGSSRRGPGSVMTVVGCSRPMASIMRRHRFRHHQAWLTSASTTTFRRRVPPHDLPESCPDGGPCLRRGCCSRQSIPLRKIPALDLFLERRPGSDGNWLAWHTSQYRPAAMPLQRHSSS